MYSHQRPNGPCHCPGRRGLWSQSPNHPRDIPVGVNYVDRSIRGQLSNRRKRLYLRPVRIQGRWSQRPMAAKQCQQKLLVHQHLNNNNNNSQQPAAAAERQQQNQLGIGQQLQGYAPKDGLPIGPEKIGLHRAIGGLCLQLGRRHWSRDRQIRLLPEDSSSQDITEYRRTP